MLAEDVPAPGMEGPHGTTIMAIRCSDGVVLGADTRASVGTVAMIRNMQKITSITPEIFVCHSGSASSTQALAKLTKYYMGVIQMNSDGQSKPKVEIAAQVLRKILQHNKNFLSAQMIVAGIDDEGPHVFMIMQTGMGIERWFAAGGSGSTYLTSYCDEFLPKNLEEREKMTTKQAASFIVQAISHAIIRDGYSGGAINIVKVTKDGAMMKSFRPQDQPVNETVVKT